MSSADSSARPKRKRGAVAGFLRSADLMLGLTGLCAVAGLLGAAAGRWFPDLGLRIPLYVVAYLCGGFGPTRDLLKSLFRGQLDINLLMIAAAGGSAVLGHWGEGAVLLFLFSLSGALEGYTMERTARSIESLVELRPETALVVRDGAERRVPVREIAVGELVRAAPGERFAVDGIVVEGSSEADESTITGESMPVEKEPGSRVFAGTVNLRGAPLVRAERAFGESTLSKIVETVQQARHAKSGTERFVERWQKPYVIAVFLGAGLAAAIPLFLGEPVVASVYKGLVLLVAASPCAVVIATPAAMLSAITHAARHGVLFKGSLHLERLGSVTALAFDKTGTITEGKPRVVRVATGGPDRPDSPAREEAEMLRLASAVEARSEHHTGRAVVAEARRRGIAIPAVSEFESHSGEGVHGHVEGRWVGVGREALFARHGITPPRAVIATAGETRARGETALLVVTRSTVDGEPVHCEGGTASPLAAPALEPQLSFENGSEPSGVIAVADSLRPGARAAIDACRTQGIRHIAILTGDHERVARPVAEAAGVDEVRAGLMPDEKVSAIRDLLRRWPTLAMAGDGVNDAPALATATVGIAMGGAGTDVALDTADVVLMRDDLKGIPFSLWLARRARRVVIQSLSFAFGVIGVLVISTLSGVLPLWLAVVCHEGSTLLTIANGVRLLAIPHRDFELG